MSTFHGTATRTKAGDLPSSGTSREKTLKMPWITLMDTTSTAERSVYRWQSTVDQKTRTSLAEEATEVEAAAVTAAMAAEEDEEGQNPDPPSADHALAAPGGEEAAPEVQKDHAPDLILPHEAVQDQKADLLRDLLVGIDPTPTQSPNPLHAPLEGLALNPPEGQPPGHVQGHIQDHDHIPLRGGKAAQGEVVKMWVAAVVQRVLKEPDG